MIGTVKPVVEPATDHQRPREASMVLLAQLQVASSYWAVIVPAHVILGIGLGAAFSAALNLGTYGVRPEDAGAASAMVNTSQQVGGAIGTALLNTIAAGATAGWLAARSGADPMEAAVHGYTTAFWWSAAIVVLAAVIVAVCVNAKPQTDEVAPTSENADAATSVVLH